MRADHGNYRRRICWKSGRPHGGLHHAANGGRHISADSNDHVRSHVSSDSRGREMSYNELLVY